MSTFKENDRIKVKAGTLYYDELGNQTGTVVNVFDFVNIAIVEFSEGVRVKLPFCDMRKVVITPPATEKSNDNVPEGAKLITKEDFDRAVMSATLKNVDPRAFIGSITGTIVGHNLSRKIFESQDTVYMTKDQFIDTLWDNCSPANVGKTIDREMSDEKCVSVSIAAMIGLKSMIRILFGESEELD